MKHALKGLRPQLALFYVLLSLPALLIIERAVFGWKFENMLVELDDGRVEQLLQREAVELKSALDAGLPAQALKLRLQNLVLRLERPRESLGTSAAFVLLELAPHPFEARLRGHGGLELAADMPPANIEAEVRRSWSVPLPGPDPEAARLELELAVPTPWRLSLEAISFEWRLAVAYLVIFLLGSAWFLRWRVLGRISRMVEAAGAWARGEFGVALADRGADELGSLAGALDRMASELQTLVGARARLASLEERQRLARDLHDTVKQKAFALSLQLAAARSSPNEAARGQRLQEASGLAEEIQHELAELLQDMRSSLADHEPGSVRLDLVPALQQRVENFSRRSGLRCETALPAALPLPTAVAEAALRVLDEALANVWRHAQAQRVRIELIEEADAWTLDIKDDGRGFDPSVPSGMGLANMRERARAVGAGFELMSAAGQGARLRLRIDAALMRMEGEPGTC